MPLLTLSRSQGKVTPAFYHAKMYWSIRFYFTKFRLKSYFTKIRHLKIICNFQKYFLQFWLQRQEKVIDFEFAEFSEIYILSHVTCDVRLHVTWRHVDVADPTILVMKKLVPWFHTDHRPNMWLEAPESTWLVRNRFASHLIEFVERSLIEIPSYLPSMMTAAHHDSARSMTHTQHSTQRLKTQRNIICAYFPRFRSS